MNALRLAVVAGAAILVSPLPVTAEAYPDRVVRIVNPFPPGGSVDVMARLLAQKLSENTGQQFIVETRAGAGGNVGAESVAKSEPDGYTLLFTAPDRSSSTRRSTPRACRSSRAATLRRSRCSQSRRSC